MSNDIDLKVLEGLSEEEKQAALKILEQFAATGSSDLLDDLKYADFEEIPVTIDEFIDGPQFLRSQLWEKDIMTGKETCKFFPYWRKTLNRLFPDNLTTAYNTLVLTGGIGLGKTLAGIVALLYLLYRMLCLKDPYQYYGMIKNDKITFSMLNVTLDAAKGVAWDKLQNFLQGSPWFMSHGQMNASRSNPQWSPPKGIELIFGSNNRHVVGRALFANLTDEVNFGVGNNVEKQKEKQKKMIAQIDARMVSRFGKGTYLPTLNIIISSKDTEQAFLNDYIETKQKNESKTTLIIDEPQWVVRNDKGTPDDPGAFYVAIGNKFLAHELLPVNADEELVNKYREKGYTMLKVPPIYREQFADNLDQALMDQAGYSSGSSTKFISGVRLNQAKTDKYQNPFTKDVIVVGNAPDDHLQYANFFDLTKVNPADKYKPLFIHLDMSYSSNGDKTGIAGTWITDKKPSIPGDDNSRSLRYKLAFSVSIKAPKGYQVSFEKNRNFIRWLRDQGFNVRVVTSDTFQSATLLQELKADGFNTQVQSVDRVEQIGGDSRAKACLPYEYLKSAIYERRVEIYQKCDLLSDELANLEKNGNGKVDHPTGGSKDQADAVCGSLYTASKFADEYAYNFGENLEAGAELNELTDADRRTQMIADFQAELAKIYTEVRESANFETQEEYNRKREFQDQMDILDGILVF